ncbi:MAG: helix-turn-helix domain-containing protein [Alphaproteobacteria bacterium]|nr:helix-turn-helix domain-containing protein [Alphaproteobacteria bacterium]MBP7758607.1 helix-turn-helix domain-containing protein [Alphaproteobacteria bacterium]MBP7762039.1 helix-turn-helix domain-containing protein [Alphaproteobacteria bacterium]MBP7904060.1 helix-turn-helix domain-containing protein [Alphaproteobacteria bacterium]
MKPLLTMSIEETRAATGLGRTKLYQLINNGELKARKIGKRTVILKDDLEAFLKNLPSYNSQNAGV